jgi:uncharacterized protein
VPQAFLLFGTRPRDRRVYIPFIANLKLSFKFDGSYSPQQQTGKRRWGRQRFKHWTGAALGEGGNDKTGRLGMFQGHIDQDAAMPVEATAIPDVLFERGMYWASGRSGVVNLVAAHKWFNLAALKGRADAVAMRREVAAMMSDAEIAAAQREARAWMTAH